jgi:singapore isolate B (sub-type 7) whole genome shotgun sequence assembly, scaffold_10
LDGKRSTNIGIALSKVKADYSTLRRALLLMKPELAGITLNTIDSLSLALPNSEDIMAAKQFSGPVDQLAPVGSMVRR